MDDFNIMTTITNFIGASRRLEAELTFIADELEKINATRGEAVDDETKTLNVEIERRAQDVSAIVSEVIDVREDALKSAFWKLSYAIDATDPELIEEMTINDFPPRDEADRYAKIDVAALMGFEFDDEEEDGEQ